MASTYEPIASTTLASAAASYTFTSIPGTFTDLVLVSFIQPSVAANRGLYLRFNSDTGSNYSGTYLSGDGSSATSGRQSNQTSLITYTTFSQASWTASRVQIIGYANTNVYKTVLSEGSAPSINVRRSVGLWRDTSAITSITALPNADDFAAGSTFSLFGVKAA